MFKNKHLDRKILKYWKKKNTVLFCFGQYVIKTVSSNNNMLKGNNLPRFENFQKAFSTSYGLNKRTDCAHLHWVVARPGEVKL